MTNARISRGLRAIAVAVLGLSCASACGAPDVETAPPEGDLDLQEVQQAVTGDDMCWGGASESALALSWVETVGAPTVRSTLTLRISNPRTTSATADLVLSGVGLDDRRVDRPYGRVTVAPGATATRLVRMGDLPLQGLTYSSEGSLSAVVSPSSGDPVRISAPSFYYHFSSGYASASVYSHDAMISSVSGGQLATNAFDLQARVYNLSTGISKASPM